MSAIPLKRLILVASATLMVLALCNGENPTRNIFDYVIHHESLQENVRRALLSLETSGMENASQLGQLINEAAAAENKPLRHIYQTLAKLAQDGNEQTCHYHLVLCCLAIMTQDELRQFRPLVEASRVRLLRCSENNELQLKEVLLKENETNAALKSLDEFLRAGLKLTKDVTDDEYLDHLRKLELTEAEFNFRQMLQVARRHKLQFAETPTLSKCSSAKKLETFLTDRCKHFYLFLRGSFDTINLGQALGGVVKGTTIQILNELQRICTQWTKQKVRLNTFQPVCTACYRSKHILMDLVNTISRQCGEP